MASALKDAVRARRGPDAGRGNGAVGGGLMAEEVAIDLESDRFRDDPVLQDAFDNRPPLKRGDDGTAVATLQQAMIDLGQPMPKSTKNGQSPADGIYGPETARVVEAIQGRQGIKKDGIAGRQTPGELDGLFSGRTPPGTPAPSVEGGGGSVAVTASDVLPQRHEPCGYFEWDVKWGTTGRNGHIVQEVRNKYDAKMCDGTPIIDPTTPRYWEAWRVRPDGSIAPTSVDQWRRPNQAWANETSNVGRGTWAMFGKVHFVPQLDPAAGWTLGGGIGDVGNLWATTKPPSNLGPELLTRSAAGAWTCCEGVATHVPVPPGSGDSAPDAAAPGPQPAGPDGPAPGAGPAAPNGTALPIPGDLPFEPIGDGPLGEGPLPEVPVEAEPMAPVENDPLVC